MTTARRLVSPLLLVLATAWAAPAHADKHPDKRADKRADVAAADKLFQEGRAAAEKGDYETACVKLRESQRLDPGVGTAYNLGTCEEHLGRLGSAWARFDEVVQETKPDDERNGLAKDRADKLDPRVPKLTFTVPVGAPAGLTITRDGAALADEQRGKPVRVDPGYHNVVIEAPGHKKRTIIVALSEGDEREIDAGPGGEGEGDEADETPLAPVRKAGYIAVGAGSAVLVLGTALGVLTILKKSTVNANCPGMVCNQVGFDAVSAGRALGAGSAATFVLGTLGVGFGVGAILVGNSAAAKAERRKNDNTTTTTALLPAFGPTGASLTLLHSF
jgi:hypothetical protein